MRRALTIAIASITAAAAFAGPASAGSTHGNIVDVAVSASGGGEPDSNANDYDLLVQAVTASGLAPTLSSQNTKLTVFAPNDRAFLRLVHDLTGKRPASEQAALETITSTLTGEQIKNVLLYHVVPGKRLSPRQVLKSRSLTMANGRVVRPRGVVLKDETKSLRDPKLVLRAINIGASNGVIHTIDRVLVPAVY
jgi:uncharacterized surface protein with fasciclin (FAS1) repeats